MALTLLAVGICTMYIILVGFLEIQSLAVSTGVIIGWGTSPLAVSSPEVPFFQNLAIVSVSALMLYAIQKLRASCTPTNSFLLLITTGTSLVIFCCSIFIFTPMPLPSPLENTDSALLNIFRSGSSSSAVLVMIAAVIVLLFRQRQLAKKD